MNPAVFVLGTDRSAGLVAFAAAAARAGRSDAHVADGLALPHPRARFDFAISIAVVHHFSSRERRVAAVRAILETLRPEHGRALVYVWALEQKHSRRGWDEGHSQDVYVPWVLAKQYDKAAGGEKTEKKKTRKQKKYVQKGEHAALQEEQEKAVQKGEHAALQEEKAVQKGEHAAALQEEQEKAVQEQEKAVQEQEKAVQEQEKAAPASEGAPAPDESPKEVTYQRYYHLYRKGELEEDVASAGGFVAESGYERDNWYVVCGRR